MSSRESMLHWSEQPELSTRVREVFDSLPPKTWTVAGWNHRGWHAVAIDVADVHRIIADILSVES